MLSLRSLLIFCLLTICLNGCGSSHEALAGIPVGPVPENVTISSLDVTPADGRLAEGETQQFSSTAKFSDGTQRNVSRYVSWASSKVAVANIDAHGKASALAPGVTTISVKLGPLSASTTLTVSDSVVTVASIEIQPKVALSAPGSRRQYAAVATLSDGTTREVTEQAVWSSSNDQISLDNDSVSPNKAGQARLGTQATDSATITATMEGVSGSARLDVGAFAYVANYGSDDVTAFTIDSLTGALARTFSPFAAQRTPWSVAVHPSGRFLFVANLDSSDISSYTIDPAEGQLDSIPPAFKTGDDTEPYALAVSPNGRFLYVVNSKTNDISVLAIAPEGALSFAGRYASTGSEPGAIAITPQGRFAYVVNFQTSDISIFELDGESASMVALGTGTPTSTQGINPESATVDPTGRFLYVTNSGDGLDEGSVAAFKIEPDGNLTPVAGSPFQAGQAPSAVAVEPGGRYAYVTNYDSNDVSAFTIDANSGALSELTDGPFGTLDSPLSLTVDPSGRFLYAANVFGDDVSKFKIEQASGALSEESRISTAGSNPISIVTTP